MAIPSNSGNGLGAGPPALPPPQPPSARPDPTAGQVERALGGAAGGSVNFNASILDALRQSSASTTAKLSFIQLELKGLHKDFNKLAKDLEPVILYYKKKAAKWASVEEQFFRDGLKLFAQLKGVADKFPASSSAYEKSKYAAAPPSDRERDANGQFKSKNPSSPVTKPAQVEAFWSEWTKEAGLWKSGFKTFADYAQSPLRLVDTVFARLGAGISMAFKAREAEAQDKKLKAEELQQKELANAEEIKQKRMEDEEKQEDLDEFFDRLRQTLSDTFGSIGKELTPQTSTAGSALSTLAIGEVKIGVLTVGSLLIGSVLFGTEPETSTGMRNVSPEEAEKEPLSLTQKIRQVLMSPGEAEPGGAELIPAQVQYSWNRPPEAGEAPMRNVTPMREQITQGILALLSGPSAAVGSYDAVEANDDFTDSLGIYLGDMAQFFLAPEDTAVGRFLSALARGGEGAAGSTPVVKDSTLKIELPLWLTPVVWAALAEFALIAGGVLLIGVAAALIAATLFKVLPWLVASICGILNEVAAGVHAVVVLFTSMIPYILQFVQQMIPVVISVLKGIGEALVGFFEHPGAFIAELVTGIGKGIESLVNSLSGAVRDAFENIPILSAISTAISGIATGVGNVVSSVLDTVSKVITKVGDNIGKIVDAVGALGTNFLKGIGTTLGIISGIMSALMAIIGGTIVLAVADLAATMSGALAWLLAGGLNPLKASEATSAFNAAYAASEGSMSGLVASAASTMAAGSTERAVMESLSGTMLHKGAAKDAKAASAARAVSEVTGSPASATGSTSHVTQTNVQQAPTFASIPIYGGGF